MRSDRPQGRGPGRPRRVSLLVDHGGLQAFLPALSDGSLGVDDLAGRLQALASSLGRVVAATAYADWTASGEDASAYSRRGVEPRLVLPLETGDDRGDVVLALDAITSALTVPGIGIYVIASSDASLSELAVRLRRMGREVVVCGPREETAAQLVRSADRFIPFETLLGKGAPEPAPVGAPPAAFAARPAPVEVDFSSYDWSRFLRLLDDLEKRLGFVGLKYLNHKVLNRENCGFDDRARRQALINHAIDSGILETYQIDNIEAGGDPVTACRLNREHETVIGSLGRPASPRASGAPSEPPRDPGDAPTEEPSGTEYAD